VSWNKNRDALETSVDVYGPIQTYTF